jgi:hypothetical protein
MKKLTKSFYWKITRKLKQNALINTVQGKFLIPHEAFQCNDHISKSLFVEGNFEHKNVTKSFSFLREKGFIRDSNSVTLFDLTVNNGVIPIDIYFN